MGAILLSLAYEFGHIAAASSDSYRSRDSGRAYMGRRSIYSLILNGETGRLWAQFCFR